MQLSGPYRNLYAVKVYYECRLTSSKVHDGRKIFIVLHSSNQVEPAGS